MESHPSPSSRRDKRSRPPSSWRQRGFGLLETAMLVLLIGSVITAGFLVLQSRKPIHEIKAQNEALLWADRALVAYAAQHARLPCPVDSPTSDESACVGPGQKGWLPVKALHAVNPTGGGPGRPLRYMVYRGGDSASDLAVASNQFNPSKWDGEAHDFDAINGLDLCAVLAKAAQETGSTTHGDRARTTDIDGRSINVAYGLSAAGTTPGDAGGRFDGINQQDRAEMEAPSRGRGGDYDDRVHVRDFNTLAQTLGCAYADRANPDGLVLASLDMLALAVDVSDEVDDQHEGNKEDTSLAVELAITSEVFAALNVALAGVSIINAGSTLATASGQLAGAIASCIVLVGCAFIPIYTAAVVAGALAVALSITATGLASGALAETTEALNITKEARDLAHKPRPKGPTDLARMTEQACLAAEGGYRLWDWETDPVTGESIEITLAPPGIYVKGLRQEVEETRELIKDIDEKIASNQSSLDRYWSGTLPNGSWMFNPGNPPAKNEDESEEDHKKRVTAWEATLPAWRQNQLAILRTKLRAIDKSEGAHYAWDVALREKEKAGTELEQMRIAIAELEKKITENCPAPAGDLLANRRCTNNSNSLLGLTQYHADYTSVVDGKPQYLGEKERDYDAAVAAEKKARDHHRQLERDAVNLPQPRMYGYSFPWNGDACIFLSYGCQTLIIPNQKDNDKRETYARTHYQGLYLKESRRLKEEELQKREAAYAQAVAQCETLRNMASGGSNGGDPMPVWAGAEAILKAANCKGATGPIQPLDCGIPASGGTP